MADVAENELLDYEEEDQAEAGNDAGATNGAPKKEVKGAYVSIHSSGFRDFLLKPELLRSIVDNGFEHPSEVQHECIPQAVLGMDILCQAKSGMGKTAVFVLATMQQLEPVEGQVSVLVMCHTRELAFQISKEYERFSKYMSGIKVISHSSNPIIPTCIYINWLYSTYFRLEYFSVDLQLPKMNKYWNPIALTLSLELLVVFLLLFVPKSWSSSTSNISFLTNVTKCLNN